MVGETNFNNVEHIRDIVLLQCEEDGGMYTQQNRIIDFPSKRSTQTYSNFVEDDLAIGEIVLI